MNDLSSSSSETRRCILPLPRPAIWVVVPCLLLGLSFSFFVLAVIHNAVLLILLLCLLLFICLFLSWNLIAAGKDEALLFFLRRFPLTDLRSAMDGDLVKIYGRVECGNLALESSYEKASRCVYTSTLLYRRQLWSGFFRWKLIYSERFATDFHIVDSRSGARATVRAGHGSKLIPLVNESVLVNTETKSGSLSLTLVKWLKERQLSTEEQALRLEEGYVKEGTQLTVMGVVNRVNDGYVTIVPISVPISTGCVFRKLLLPMAVDGLIFKFSDDISLEEN